MAGPAVGDGLADRVAGELPGALRERFPDTEWRVELRDAPQAGPTARSQDLVEAVRRRMLREGWDLGVGLTDLPLTAGRRPVSAHASATHGVGLVSVPALGAVGVRGRLMRAVLHLVEGLVGESAGRDADADADGDREARIARRLKELASPLGRARVRDDGTIRFVSAAIRGNLRLLVGMVRANRPARVVMRLAGALVGALGVGAISLASSNLWQLADGMSWPRLLVLCMFSIAATCVALVLAHGLWEHTTRPQAREQVVLFNIATVATLAIGVLALYIVLLALTLGGAAALIPPQEFHQAVGHPVGVSDYLQLAWLVTSLATVGGALGSMVDGDLAVREATYPTREDERTESGDDVPRAP